MNTLGSVTIVRMHSGHMGRVITMPCEMILRQKTWQLRIKEDRKLDSHSQVSRSEVGCERARLLTRLSCTVFSDLNDFHLLT